MTIAGTPTPVPIFASVDSPPCGLPVDDGGILAVGVAEGGLVIEVAEGELFVKLRVDVATRVCV
jgi:hypothetical protein